MEFQTKYLRVKKKGEINSGKRITEQSGYIPAKEKIEEMIFAGQRLNIARDKQYDFNGEKIDEDFDDPTRRPGYDMAEASMEIRRIRSRMAELQAQERTILAEEEKKKSDSKADEEKGDKPV